MTEMTEKTQIDLPGGIKLEVSQFEVILPARSRPSAIIQRRAKTDGTATWAVYDPERLHVLNKKSKWELDPLPSNRDDDYDWRCRFATIEDAAMAYYRFNNYPGLVSNDES